MPTKPAQSQTQKPAKRAPKLPQLERTRSRVIDAAAALLLETALRDLTIEHVAQRSGIARSTIYRHWDNIAELAIDAFDAALGPNPPPPDLGDIRSDLIALYKRFAKILRAPIWRTVLPSLLEASMKDARFRQLLNGMVDARRADERLIFARAIERGEIARDAPVEWALDAVTGAYYHRLLLSGADVSEKGMAEWLVDAALAQIKLPPAGS